MRPPRRDSGPFHPCGAVQVVVDVPVPGPCSPAAARLRFVVPAYHERDAEHRKFRAAPSWLSELSCGEPTAAFSPRIGGCCCLAGACEYTTNLHCLPVYQQEGTHSPRSPVRLRLAGCCAGGRQPALLALAPPPWSHGFEPYPPSNCFVENIGNCELLVTVLGKR